ncbi:hypothetical protein [uncultured Aquimarina sp.]|uniref:hypothetical protein n=1 Tax=uncultured Aquimarina sp. TaxID=575652 RepID=UPI00260BCC0D|nr:hypothetical protein [uncultured Aquimarina sp.]
MNKMLCYSVFRSLVYALTIVYVLFLGAILESDSSSYINLSIIATPGYPSFLFFFKKVFGQSSFQMHVVITQLLINILIILYVVKVFKRVFDITRFLLIGLDLVLLSPLLIPSLLVANRITTEALAYPIFILIIVLFLRGFLEQSQRYLIYCCIAVFFGLLVRTQLFFILPVFVIILLYQLYKTRRFKLFGIPLFLVLLIPILVSLVDKSFHFAVHNQFENTSNTGVQVAMIPFFVADREDYKVFEEKKVQDYYKYLYDNAVQVKMLDEYYTPKYGDNVYHYFHDNYATLSYGVLSLKGREFLHPMSPESVDAIIENDKLLTSMVIPLFFQNFSKCVDLYFKNVIHAFRGMYSFLFYLILLIGSLVFWLKASNKIAFFTAFVACITFSNIALVCLVEHSLDRYMFYHQWMLPVLLILMLNEISKRLSHTSASEN